MALQLLLNIFIAFTWMFLSSSYELSSFFGGFIIGLLMLFIMRRFFSRQFYLINIYAAFKLLLIFIRELFLSNFAILKVILRPKLDINPGIFALPIELTKDWEITVLSNLITLTPGTLVLEVSNDRKWLYIHAMDVKDVDDAINSIKNTFEKAIKEVGR